MRLHLLTTALLSACCLPAADLASWRIGVAERAADPTVVRLYTFEQAGSEVPNRAAGAGNLLLAAVEPYFDAVRFDGGRIADAPRWTCGRFPGKPALEFGRAKDGVKASRFYRTPGEEFSVLMWVRPHPDPAGTSDATLVSVGNGVGNGWTLSALHYGTLLRLGRTEGDVLVSAPKVLTGGVWHQVAALISAGRARLAIDGEVVAEVAFPGVFEQPALPTGHFVRFPDEERNGLKLGSIQMPGNTWRFDCDELAIHAACLEPEAVRTAFLAGRPEQTGAEQTAAHRLMLAERARRDRVVVSLPQASYGYLPAGGSVPLQITVPAEAGFAGAVTVQADLRDTEGTIVSTGQRQLGADGSLTWDLAWPERRGLYDLAVSVREAGGRTVVERRLPAASINQLPPIGKRPLTSPLGAHGGLFIWPEAVALGVRYERDIACWRPAKAADPTGWDFTWVDREITMARALGLEPLYCEHTPSYDKGFLDRVVAGDTAAIDNWFRPLIARHADNVTYWEVCNEPNARGCDPVQYVAVLKRAHAAIRAFDPTARIVGACGVTDYPAWTEGVLAAGGGAYMDILSFHNYLGASPIRAWQREHKIERVRTSMRKHLDGRELPIWNSENGIHQPQRFGDKPLDEDQIYDRFRANAVREEGITLVAADAVTMASEHVSACWQVQSTLLDLGLGVQRTFMLMGASRYYPSGSPGYGCDGYPSEKGIAYAAMASVLNDMASARLLPLASRRIAGVVITSLTGTRTAALFAEVPTVRPFRVGRPGTVHGMDHLGNPLRWEPAGGIISVPLGLGPVYLHDVAEDFAEAGFLAFTALPERISPDETVGGSLTICNLLPTPLRGRIELSGTDLTGEMLPGLELAPGERRELPFTVRSGRLARGSGVLSARLLLDGREFTACDREFASEGVAREVPSRKIAVDGDPADWAGIPREHGDTMRQVAIGRPPVGYNDPKAWQGPAELSFRMATAWRAEEGLFLLVEATDHQLKTVAEPDLARAYAQDAIELFLDLRPLPEQKPPYAPGVEQLIIVPRATPEAGPCLVRSFARHGAVVTVEAVGRRTATGYLLEARLKPLAPLAAGQRFGFDLAIDDAGEGPFDRRVQLVMHGGEGSSHDTSRFGRYRLAP